MRYTRGHRQYPMILGHECAGIVTEVGEGVSPDWIGRHAAVVPLVPCLTCDQCLAGRFSACRSYSFIGSRQSGGFAERLALPECNLLPLPESIPFEQAALIEPATVARHALDLGGFTLGQSVAVFGAGSVGLMAVQWLRILGAANILCTDISEVNLEAAQKLGATLTANPLKVDIRQVGGTGIDLALEVAGVPQTLQQALQVVHPQGVIVCIGNQPLDASLPMSFIEELMRKEAHLVGCFMSYSAPFPGHEWGDAVEALKMGWLDLGCLISHRFPLAQAPEVFADLAAHRLVHQKIIFTP